MGANADSVAKGWATRRAQGRKHANRLVDQDGLIREDAIIEDKETGCWNWQYSCRGITPQVVVETGSSPISVRGYLYERAGFPPLKAYYAACGNHRCVNPDHTTGERTQYLYLAKRAVVREFAKSNRIATTGQIANSLGIGKETVREALGKRPTSATGRRWWKRTLPKQPARVDDRQWDMFVRVARGESMQEVASSYGLSRERVRSVCEQVESWIKRERKSADVQKLREESEQRSNHEGDG
jgi:hypothetical protein